MDVSSDHAPKPIKRLNATLPEPLARYVAEMTGDQGLYETPSEFVRDLIRRHMEQLRRTEVQEINQLLQQSLAENSYSPLRGRDFDDLRRTLSE